MNILDEVKTRLSITGTDLDETIQGMIDDVISYCRSAGLKYTQLVSTRAVGLIARGVADLWNYGAGNGKFSDIFQLRLNQMTLDAASLDHDVELQEKSVTITENGTTTVTPDDGYVLSSVNVDVNVPSKPEQAKSVTITENGTTAVTPDGGYVLSSVNVDVNVAGGPSIVTIPPVSLPLMIGELNLFGKVTDIDLGAIEWAQAGIKDISNLFRNLANLKSIKWGDLPSHLADSVDASYLFYYDRALEYIDLTPFGALSISNAQQMFNGCGNLKNIAWGNVKVRAQSMGSMFYQCTSMNSIDTSFLDHEYTGTTSISSMFYQCSQLKTLDLSNLNTVSITTAYYLFKSCGQLTNVVFENGCFSNTKLTQLEIEGAPLSHDCAVDIFNKLATRTNSPTLKLSATTKGYLTESEIAIATGKGWVVS